MTRITIITFLFLTLISFNCSSQGEDGVKNVRLSISPTIDKENDMNQIIISQLEAFLESKNSSLSENSLWLKSDFDTYIFPYLDIYYIERSQYGNYFFQPTLMEIIGTEIEDTKILKLAYIGHNEKTGENFIRCVYNILAKKYKGAVVFSNYLNLATKEWLEIKDQSITYKISVNREINEREILSQKKDIDNICRFFDTKPIQIHYYSCISPVEVFQIKGFDYNPLMYVGDSGGLSVPGNIVFSANNSEKNSHEIVHVYTSNLNPKIDKLLDEGLATLIGGSGGYGYSWNRKKMEGFLSNNKMIRLEEYVEPYERHYIDNETSIPYMIGALICERTLRIFGKEKLLEILHSEEDFWKIMKTVGLSRENLTDELNKEVQLPFSDIFLSITDKNGN